MGRDEGLCTHIHKYIGYVFVHMQNIYIYIIYMLSLYTYVYGYVCMYTKYANVWVWLTIRQTSSSWRTGFTESMVLRLFRVFVVL